MARPKPVVLIICDGWGVALDTEGNAITRANTPVFKRLLESYPAMTLRASGSEVGLSWGEMGNSEVGHLTIGAGKILYQMLPKIDRAIESGELYENSALNKAVDHALKYDSALHLMGILSPGHVHGMDSHAYALLELAKRKGVKKVFVHAILDGRDTLYNSGVDFVTSLLAKMKELEVGQLASLMGRYYAMDRDNRAERTEKAYNLLVVGTGNQAEDPLEALAESYRKEIFDEQFEPTVLTSKGKPVATVGADDAVIFWNFRPDRARQISHAFCDENFDKFKRQKIQNLLFVGMVEYEAGLPQDFTFG
ncbi:MAG: 2,3-bisphosphoglycerate-independent phosphoglycerate mutase, partial [bacterium]